MTTVSLVGLSIVLFVVSFGSVLLNAAVNQGKIGLWGKIIPAILCALGIAAFVMSVTCATDDVQSGVVIGQEYTPTHQNAPVLLPAGKTVVLMPGAHVPDDWAIEVKNDKGYTDWKHFDKNVFGEYPIGSHYPH